jgi:hypothetical protein
VRVGAGELGEHVGVEAVRIAAAGAVAITGGRQLVRMHGDDGDAGVEQPGDDQPVRLLARDPRHLQLAKAADERLDPVLCVADPSLLEPSPVGIHDDQSVLLRSIPAVRSCRPSVGRRPVASHRREALVSRGPSVRQATRALSRRWSATSPRYGPRRSTPALTACGLTLGFQRTDKTQGKVAQ